MTDEFEITRDEYCDEDGIVQSYVPPLNPLRLTPGTLKFNNGAILQPQFTFAPDRILSVTVETLAKDEQYEMRVKLTQAEYAVMRRALQERK